MFITISICISICRTCLVLSVVVRVHFICFTVGEWETFFSIPLYVLTCKVIDNKATLTLTLKSFQPTFSDQKVRCAVSKKFVNTD